MAYRTSMIESKNKTTTRLPDTPRQESPSPNTSPAGRTYRHHLSLKKISIEKNGEATVISYTSNKEFFKGKIESLSESRFLLELTQHIPPREFQYIRRYGHYAPRRRWYGIPAARTKGKWPDRPHVMRLVILNLDDLIIYNVVDYWRANRYLRS